jgi:hypothetical protein
VSALQVYALGSPFGIDRLAWAMIEATPRDARWRAQRINGCEVLLSGWSHSRVEQALIVDTVLEPTQEPFSLLQLQRAALQDNHASLSAHTLNLSEALNLAETLDLLPAQLWICGISVPDIATPWPPAETIDNIANELHARLSKIEKTTTERTGDSMDGGGRIASGTAIEPAE